MILPGETKTFTFFFKSLNAGVFRECWAFGTHPTLLGGAVLQVNLYAVSLAQDIFMGDRKLLEVRDPGSWPLSTHQIRYLVCFLALPAAILFLPATLAQQTLLGLCDVKDGWAGNQTGN